ncbi:MAG: flagellar biosynthesis protein FlhB [Armatimonadota bacterium]
MALQDKTEAASPRRREEARKEGKVAKSTDLISAVGLLFSLLLIKSAGPYLMGGMSSMMRQSLSNLHHNELTIDALRPLAISYGMKFFQLCLPILAVTAVVGIAANVLQVGFMVSPKAIAPDLNRIDPIKGFARLFAGRSIVELLKSIAKVSIVSYFVYTFLKSEYPVLLDLAGLTPSAMVDTVTALGWRLVIRGCIVLLIIGILDYMYQRLQFEQSIKMTKQEVKEEYKRSEGDPQIKSKIRQRQREMARHRMIQDVSKADFVVTNPTHFAVAIKYDPSKMAAPVVLAKGQRLLALKIREVATANGVPIIENPPVARFLYKNVEVGQPIPEDLYQAVAEMLAYVYQLSQKAGKHNAA